MKSQNKFIPCPNGGRCFNPLCIFGCINHNKRIKCIAIGILIALSLLSLNTAAQVGCSTKDVINAINIHESTIFHEYYEDSVMVTVKTTDNSMFIFNMAHDICVYLTAIIPMCSNDLLFVTQLFPHCNYGMWESHSTYNQINNTTVYRIKLKEL